jgi:hypothetical protein
MAVMELPPTPSGALPASGPPDPALKSLSRLVIVLAALFLTALGVISGIVAAHTPEGAVGTRMLTGCSDALISAGVTTLLLTLAFYHRIEIAHATRHAFRTYVVPALDQRLIAQTSQLMASVDERTSASGTQLSEIKRAVDRLALTAASKVQIFQQGEIYAQSIKLLEEIDHGTIRILMSVTEDPSSSEQGRRWLDALTAWLDEAPSDRRVQRVIAIPNSHGDEQIEQACCKLVDPFIGKSASQWFLVDDEFSLSVMLMNDQFCVFGFLKRHDDPRDPRTSFEYAVDVENVKLSHYLAGWFEATYIQSERAFQVMDDGSCRRDGVAAFKQHLPGCDG